MSIDKEDKELTDEEIEILHEKYSKLNNKYYGDKIRKNGNI